MEGYGKFSDIAYKKTLPEFIDEITKSEGYDNSPSAEIANLFKTVLELKEGEYELAIYLYSNPNAAEALEQGYYRPDENSPGEVDSILSAAAYYLSTEPVKEALILSARDIDKVHKDRKVSPLNAGMKKFKGQVLTVPIIAYNTTQGYVVIVFPNGAPPYAIDSLEIEFLTRAMQLAALVYQKNRSDATTDHNLVTDYLTSLPNREHIYEMIIYSLQMSELYATKFVLMIVRINGLKNINNALGIFTGDATLKQIGTMVKETAQASVTETEPFVGRLTGSDFAIIINLGQPKEDDGVSDETQDSANDTIKNCCEAIIEKIKDFIEVYGYKLYLSVNIGASIYPNHGATAEELIRKADLAKGISKHNMPNSFEVYSNEMDGDIEKVMFLSNNLPDAITDNQFELFYQAQVNVATGKPEGAEALIRWNHPEKGMIFPGYFIPYAEDNGYGVQLDVLVLGMVCDRINLWAAKGINLPVSVNISPKHFIDGHICDTVSRIISSKGIDPAMLKIELLESALVDNFDVTVNAITRLREMGVAVALDDFGTGYSSLEYVMRLPLDYLKIDREFSMNLEKNPNNKILMETIMTLANGMKVKTIVEGVEDQYQFDYLKTIGADLAQGYFINKPLPVDAFEELLRVI